MYLSLKRADNTLYVIICRLEKNVDCTKHVSKYNVLMSNLSCMSFDVRSLDLVKSMQKYIE